MRLLHRAALAAAILGSGIALSACESLEGNVGLGVVGATAFGAQSPTHEVEQIYYVGAFDPLDQLEPQMYRIRVRGQASLLSQVGFASGWVRADLIDSLGTTLKFDEAAGGVVIKKTDDTELARIGGGRKIFQFGPEGTRKVPEDHRLAIVMGSSPEAFFQAVDSVLGTVAETVSEQHNAKLRDELFKALVQVQMESNALNDVQKDIALDVKAE